jgi:hypothetical protein
MRLLMAIFVSLFFFASSTSALTPIPGLTVVEDTHMSWEAGGGSGDYFAKINQEVIPCCSGNYSYTGAYFNFPVGNDSLFEGAGHLVDEGSVWYLVEPGDVFTEATIMAGKFLSITGGFGSLPDGNNAIPLPGEEFYLGVATAEDNEYDTPNIFGWLKLGLTQSLELVMLDNAVSYASKGIIIGTSTAIPEPSSIALLVGSIAACILRRSAL